MRAFELFVKNIRFFENCSVSARHWHWRHWRWGNVNFMRIHSFSFVLFAKVMTAMMKWRYGFRVRLSSATFLATQRWRAGGILLSILLKSITSEKQKESFYIVACRMSKLTSKSIKLFEQRKAAKRPLVFKSSSNPKKFNNL